MVTQSTLAMLDMKSMYEYYAHILDVKNEGLGSLALVMFNQMSEEQKEGFFGWVDEAYYYDAQDNGDNMEEIIHELEQYFRK